MTAPTIAAWAIKAPDGKILPESYGTTELRAWVAFFLAYSDTNHHHHEYWEAKGYRCVKVHITEAQE